MPAWESDNSQFHIRTRACMTARTALPERLAVLVVEDQETTRAMVAALAGQPLELDLCADPADALFRLGRTCPDAVLVGPVDGRLDPIDFLTTVRAHDPDLPVVVGAGRGNGDFAARAVEAGATTVIARPYSTTGLLGLLSSLAPRPVVLELRPPPIDLGRLRVDGAGPRMWLDGREIDLPPQEFLLLRFFAERVGAILTRGELMRGVWQNRPDIRSNTLTVHITRLRRRLGDDDHNPRWIKAIRGLGYQFIAPH